MTKLEWKEFWERFEMAAKEYSCKVCKIEASGGYKVLVSPDRIIEGVLPEIVEKEGVIISTARYALRDDAGENYYHQMLKIQWNLKGPVPFGMSKFRTVYVTPDPIAVFAMLYA